jgi:ABC-2 type transport system permease protein
MVKRRVMMHNLGTVLRFEVIRTLKKPTFWISILSIPVVGALILGIIYFTTTATQSATQKVEQEKFSFAVLDESGKLPPKMIETAGGEPTRNEAQAVEAVKSGKLEAFFHYPKDLSKQSILIYNKNRGIADNDKYTDAAKALMSSAVTGSIDPTTVAVIKENVKIEQKNYENGQEINVLGRMILPGIFLVIFYMVIVFLSNQMLTSTTEEKENRVTEMILTSIKSRSLIIGKIFALLILGVIQIVTLVLPIIAAYVFARDTLNIPDVTGFINVIEFELWPIFIGAFLLVGSLLLFTGFSVAIGAAMPTAKEANSFFGFVILFLVAPFWITSVIMSDPSATIVQVFSYFPLTAPVTLMLRNVFGDLPVSDGLIGAIIVFTASIVIMAIAIRIFRFGTLEYSNRISLGSIFKRNNKKAL